MLSVTVDGLLFVRDLISGVVKEAGEDTKSLPYWTTGVKRYLQKLGNDQRFNYRAIYTDGQGTSEFMLDFVGWRNQKPGGAIIACECEWGHTKNAAVLVARVVEDFDKLMSFKAPLKLMIFSSDGSDVSQKRVIEEIGKYLDDFGGHRAGEHYLVLDMCNKDAGWECIITADGENMPKLRQIL